MTTNWANQTIWTGDNLPILRGMNSESVDLIYLDPPFNSKTKAAWRPNPRGTTGHRTSTDGLEAKHSASDSA